MLSRERYYFFLENPYEPLGFLVAFETFLRPAALIFFVDCFPLLAPSLSSSRALYPCFFVGMIISDGWNCGERRSPDCSSSDALGRTGSKAQVTLEFPLVQGCAGVSSSIMEISTDLEV